MNERNFFAELKRRNVYKVAVAYAVVAWLLIQAASILFPTYEAPAWVMKVFVAIVALGFPIALVIAWAFEMTPEGIKRTEDVSPNETIPRWSKRKFAAFILVVVIGAAALLGYKLVGTARWTVRSEDKNDGRRSAASLPVSDKSIAVLPFENLSEDKANAFFASGIQDEILTRLAKINSLKVISRTSTQQYQSKPSSLNEIGSQLGVAHILEGSVQKIGNAVHINVQLIKAATDTHIWAESYNRKLDDIFAVEAEVAAAVAEQLNAKLTGSEKQELAQKPTDNPAAYEAYLRAITQFQRPDAMNTAVSALEEAVRLDPKFALAWAALCKADGFVYLNYIDRSRSRSEAAEKAVAEAVRLQPQLPETQLARAYYQYVFLHDYKGARELLRQLRMIWPSNAEIVQLIGYISARLGEYDKSADYLHEAIALNPRDPFLRYSTIDIHIAMRDFATALRMVDDGQQIWPDDVAFEPAKIKILQGRGELTGVQAIVDKLSASQSYRLNVIYQAKLRRIALPPYVLDACERFAENPDVGFSRHQKLAVSGYLLELSADKARSQALLVKVRDRTEALSKQQPDNWPLVASRAYALAGLGEREAALRAIDQAMAMTENDARERGQAQEMKARLLARFGDKENAIPLLQHLLEISYDGAYGPPLTPVLLRLDPDFDALRGDPRFENLCQDKPK